MKDELKKKKKLKELAEAAGAGGIKNSVSDEIKNKIISTAKETGERMAKAASETVGSMASDLIKKKKENEIKTKKDKATIDYKYAYQKDIQPGGKDFNEANWENQTAKRYEKVGVSPIYSKGKLSREDKEQDERLGNRLTEDDKVTEKSKKRNKRQY